MKNYSKIALAGTILFSASIVAGTIDDVKAADGTSTPTVQVETDNVFENTEVFDTGTEEVKDVETPTNTVEDKKIFDTVVAKPTVPKASFMNTKGKITSTTDFMKSVTKHYGTDEFAKIFNQTVISNYLKNNKVTVKDTEVEAVYKAQAIDYYGSVAAYEKSLKALNSYIPIFSTNAYNIQERKSKIKSQLETFKALQLSLKVSDSKIQKRYNDTKKEVKTYKILIEESNKTKRASTLKKVKTLTNKGMSEKNLTKALNKIDNVSVTTNHTINYYNDELNLNDYSKIAKAKKGSTVQLQNQDEVTLYKIKSYKNIAFSPNSLLIYDKYFSTTQYTKAKIVDFVTKSENLKVSKDYAFLNSKSTKTTTNLFETTKKSTSLDEFFSNQAGTMQEAQLKKLFYEEIVMSNYEVSDKTYQTLLNSFLENYGVKGTNLETKFIKKMVADGINKGVAEQMLVDMKRSTLKDVSLYIALHDIKNIDEKALKKRYQEVKKAKVIQSVYVYGNTKTNTHKKLVASIKKDLKAGMNLTKIKAKYKKQKVDVIVDSETNGYYDYYTDDIKSMKNGKKGDFKVNTHASSGSTGIFYISQIKDLSYNSIKEKIDDELARGKNNTFEYAAKQIMKKQGIKTVGAFSFLSK